MVGPGQLAPDFTLPAVTQPGDVSLADQLKHHAVLLGLFRGLHCPFCRRQIVLLSTLRDTLAVLDVTILAVVTTRRERAALYFRHHPTRVTLLADADASTHQLFGVPSVVPDETFAAVRINPTGELPAAIHPMEANAVLNARDGFVMTPVDEAIFAAHGTRLSGHFLIDRSGTVRWTNLEAERGLHTVATFPAPDEIVNAARTLDDR